MANSIPSVADRTLDPARLRTGDPVRARDVKPTVELHNAALAEAATGTVLEQSWPDDQCSHTGAIPTVNGANVPIAEWAIPLVSDAHLALAVELRGYRDAGVAGTVTLRSVGAGDEISVALGAGPASADSWTTVGTLDLDVDRIIAGTPVEIVRMFLDTDASPGDVVVEQLHAEVEALTSPLATSRIDDAPVFDPDIAEPDEPLPSAVGHGLVDGDDALRPRPNIGLIWSGLSSSYSGPDAADEMPAVDVLAAMRDHPEHGAIAMIRRPATAGDQVVVLPLRAQLPGGDAGDLTWVAASVPNHLRGRLRRADPSVTDVGLVHESGAGGIAGLSLWTRPDVGVS